MIEKLSLSPDFSKWNWEQSNGNATVELTQNSLNVLLDKGDCSDFSYLVWNDIVDMLASILSEIGIGWDDTYCSYEECKIKESLGVLMAYAWNSVAWNIKRFGFVMWKWARTASTPGCIGRDAVTGYSTAGENADNLYAWYVLELTEKLNKLIEVLQDAADFSELNYILKSSSVPYVKMAAPKIEAITASKVIASNEYTAMSKIQVREQFAINAGYSYKNSILLPVSPFLLTAKAGASTHTAAELGWFNDANLLCLNPSATMVATLLRCSDLIRTFEKAEKLITYVIAVANSCCASTLSFEGASGSKAISRLRIGHSSAFVGLFESNTTYNAFSESKESKPMFAKLISFAPYISNGNSGKSAICYSVNVSESGYECEAFAGRAKFTDVETISETAISGVMIPSDRVLLNDGSKAETIQLSEVTTQCTTTLVSANKSKSMVDAALSFYVEDAWQDPVQNGTNLYIRNAYLQLQKGSNVHLDGVIYYEPEQTETNVYIRSTESLKGV